LIKLQGLTTINRRLCVLLDYAVEEVKRTNKVKYDFRKLPEILILKVIEASLGNQMQNVYSYCDTFSEILYWVRRPADQYNDPREKHRR
jgi:hypothetical protein